MSRDKEEFVLEWISGVNQKGEPFIHLVKAHKSGKRDMIAQLDPWQVRDCALNALSAAEAAQSDAFLMGHMQKSLGLDLPSIAAFIAAFRDYRAGLGTSLPTNPEHWNAVMDDLAVEKTGKPFDPTKKQ